MLLLKTEFAAKKGEMVPDSPSGRLATLFFKLAPRGQK